MAGARRYNSSNRFEQEKKYENQNERQSRDAGYRKTLRACSLNLNINHLRTKAGLIARLFIFLIFFSRIDEGICLPYSALPGEGR
jgi:hypothetical protein